MENARFITAINCIDGRTIIPLIEWIKKNIKIDYIDLITEPGPDKILAEEKETAKIEDIKRKVRISITRHNSNVIVIAGHYDCAANPVDEETHIKQIKKATDNLRLYFSELHIIGLWIDKNWKVNKIE